jgi:hypothetical protein
MLYKKYEYKGKVVGVAVVGFGPKIWQGYFEVESAGSVFGSAMQGFQESKEEALASALHEGKIQADLYQPIRLPTKPIE